MKSSSRTKKRYFARSYRQGKDDLERIDLAKNPDTDLATLMQLQGSKNPEITKFLTSNPVLPLNKRFAMVIKYLDYPTRDVQYAKKLHVVENIQKEALNSVQIATMTKRKKLLQKSYSVALMNNFQPKSLELQKTLDTKYAEISAQIRKLGLRIPTTFAKKLKRPWTIALTYAVQYGPDTTFLRSEKFKSKNLEWLGDLSTNHPVLEIDNLNVESILDLQTPIFQQAILVLLVTHNFGVVAELIESVKETIPIYSAKSLEQDQLKAQKTKLALENFQRISAEKEMQDRALISVHARDLLVKFKTDALTNLESQLFLESRDSKGDLDNGYTWGISQKRLFELYSSKVSNRIGVYNKKMREELISIFEKDVDRSDFQYFINSLDCKDYRGNLRRFSGFPIECFENANLSLIDANLLYNRWSLNYPKSVLSANRGHVPEDVKNFLNAWSQISRLFREDAIFLCKSVGLLCRYAKFDIAIHIAFVASKPTSDGLRGQWLVVLSGLTMNFSRDLQVMGWTNLLETNFQHQEKIAPLRDSDNSFWLFQSTDSQRVMGEIGKLIEGLLFEKYGQTSIGSEAFVEEVSPEVRRKRQKILDVIFRVRRYRDERRYRPYQGYCANPDCGLPLSDPQSLARGFGPTCWKKMLGEGVIERDLTTDYDRLFYETPASLLDWEDSFVSFFKKQSMI